MLSPRTLFTTITLLYSAIAFAQNDKPADAPVQKVYTNLTPTMNLSGEFFYDKNSCFYVSSSYNFNDALRNYITPSTRLHTKVGVEINADGNWYIGLSSTHQLSYIQTQNILSGKANISHRGKIGSLLFIKELSFEYFHHFNNTFYDAKKDFQGGLGASLIKTFNVAGRPLSIMPSYKIILNSNLDFEIYKNRRVDFTKLRADIYYGITKSLYVGIFAMRDTEYFYPEGYSTADTPPVNVFFKENAVKPIIGFNLNLILHPELIENYIPGLPLR